MFAVCRQQTSAFCQACVYILWQDFLLSLMIRYCATCRELQRQYNLENNRAVPQWGKEIFSDLCIIMRPSKPEEVANFIKYAIALTQAHLQVSKQTSTVQSNRSALAFHYMIYTSDHFIHSLHRLFAVFNFHALLCRTFSVCAHSLTMIYHTL